MKKKKKDNFCIMIIYLCWEEINFSYWESSRI